jgi:hypothetical protein
VKRALVLVEGQTEEAIVGRVLGPHLRGHGVELTPTVVVTRRVRTAAPDFRGGVSSWNQLHRDIVSLLGYTNVLAVTTFLDYYRLPEDVPGMQTRPTASSHDQVQHVESEIDAEIGSHRFRSYISLHETEAVLYADPATCGNYLQNPALEAMMAAAVAQAGGPELVDNGPATAPSKRLLAAHPQYRKTIDGPTLVEHIGLPVIRGNCPHFDNWLSWMESLG